MNTELLQDRDVMIRIVLLLAPAAAFLAAVLLLLRSKRNEEHAGSDSGELRNAVMLFLPICMTNLMYSVMMILWLFINENMTADKIRGVSIFLFAMIGLLNAGSCIVKGAISGARLSYCAGAEKQSGLSKTMVYLAVAEVPGLIAFVLYVIRFIVG